MFPLTHSEQSIWNHNPITAGFSSFHLPNLFCSENHIAVTSLIEHLPLQIFGI
jgi:hypothetical protein